jgi:uncharacterized membrane protein YozB (DUF420 family)
VFAAARLDVGPFSFYLFFIFWLFSKIVVALFLKTYQSSAMFAGYFRFEHEGVMRNGYFNLFDGHQFYSACLAVFVRAKGYRSQ